MKSMSKLIFLPISVHCSSVIWWKKLFFLEYSGSFFRRKLVMFAWVYLFFLFYYYMSLFAHQYYTVLITVALYYFLKSGRVSPMILFFKIVLVILGLLPFYTMFKISLSISTKKNCWDFKWYCIYRSIQHWI